MNATIVRGVLLPASMKLLGDWNWYLPSWLQWLPHLGVSEGEADLREADAAAPVWHDGSSGTPGPWPWGSRDEAPVWRASVVPRERHG